MLIDKQILSPCTSEWGFGVVVVPKLHPSEESKEGKDVEGLWRFCCDLRPLNAHIPQDTYEPPNCSSCLQWLAGKKYRTVMDLRWGFYQCLLSEATRKIFTCVTSFGTYCYNRLTMGFINSTAEFQRHVNITLGDNLWADAMAMVDDLIIANESLESHRASSQVIWNKLARRHHSVKQRNSRASEWGWISPQAAGTGAGPDCDGALGWISPQQ